MIWTVAIAMLLAITVFACTKIAKNNKQEVPETEGLSAADILGNPNYQAISYGGYRFPTRDKQPTVSDLKEDMRLLHAMGIRILRTYNTKLAQAGNILEAIHQLKEENDSFEMYVMLGAWIDCKGAWTDSPNHNKSDSAANAAEIERAVTLTRKYPDIVKVIAVGNEAMVKWATSYFVQPRVILNWVNHLQKLKRRGRLPTDLWITSSDNFASWGGGDAEYHVPDLEKLINAVDFVSLHTYPMHDTHYNPSFWFAENNEEETAEKAVNEAMARALEYAQNQYRTTAEYIHNIAPDKPIHIGETGWASKSGGLYGDNGSKACDEYKQGLYHRLMRQWTNDAKISCFYFEGFDENWKDGSNVNGSENHFGLFTIDGKAKYAIWNLVDNGTFDGLGRNGKPVTKTYEGKITELIKDVKLPPSKK